LLLNLREITLDLVQKWSVKLKIEFSKKIYKVILSARKLSRFLIFSKNLAITSKYLLLEINLTQKKITHAWGL
jgi:hypothetical protein